METTSLQQATERARDRLGLSAAATEPAPILCRLCQKPLPQDAGPHAKHTPCPECAARFHADQQAEEAKRIEDAQRRREEALARVRADLPVCLAHVGVPPAWQGASFDHCPDLSAALVARCRGWADDPAGILYLHGRPGAGKSWLAAAVCRHVLSEGVLPPRDVYYIDERDYLARMREAFSAAPGDRSGDRAASVRLLLFDDLAATRLTDWCKGEVAGLIERRHAACLPTIITSNLNLEQVAADVDPRIASRIAQHRQAVQFPARDLRVGGAIPVARGDGQGKCVSDQESS